ncbi:hypothetical protein D3C86_640530 [compost metagenome]
MVWAKCLPFTVTEYFFKSEKSFFRHIVKIPVDTLYLVACIGTYVYLYLMTANE